jgi:predicted house-cleaning noncanonical NTP pyrophosphatase (MazG superfamily)
MPGSDGKPNRPWQEIAAEVCREKDSKRLMELIDELVRAMGERDESLANERKQKSKGESA